MTLESTYLDHRVKSNEMAGVRTSNLQPLPSRLQDKGIGQSESPPVGWLHGKAPTNEHLAVVVHPNALIKLEQHGQSNLEVELGGVLLGRVIDRRTEPTVEVVTSMPVGTSDHSPVHFTFTADTWSQLHREKNEKHPDLDVVGWYHTHPGLGVFFSADDVVVHTAAFVMPWHVALVVDPVNKAGCFFCWVTSEHAEGGRELAALPGFWELSESKEDSSAGWRYDDAPAWPKLPVIEYPRSMTLKNQEEIDDSLLPPISPWWGVILGGVSLLISILLLLDRLLGTSG